MTHLLASLQQGADDTHVTVPRGRVNGPGAPFVWHVQVHAFLEEHSGALRVAVQRRYVHQGGAVLCPLEDARLELVGQQLDYGRVAVFGGQVHGRPVLMIGDRGGRADTVEVFHQGLVTFGARYVQRGLPVALEQSSRTLQLVGRRPRAT